MTFSASDLGLNASSESGGQMARLTENLNLQRGLLRHLDGIPEVQILDKTKVSSIVQDGSNGDWPLVHLDNGKILRARLLVTTNFLPRIIFIETAHRILCRWVPTGSTHPSGLMLVSPPMDGPTILTPSSQPWSILLVVHSKVPILPRTRGSYPQGL